MHKIGDQYVYNHVVKHENNIKIVFEIEDIVVIRDILISKDAAIGDITTFENYNYWICDGKDPEGNTFQLKQKK